MEDIPRILEANHEEPPNSELESQEEKIKQIFSGVNSVEEIFSRCEESDFGESTLEVLKN